MASTLYTSAVPPLHERDAAVDRSPGGVGSRPHASPRRDRTAAFPVGIAFRIRYQATARQRARAMLIAAGFCRVVDTHRVDHRRSTPALAGREVHFRSRGPFSVRAAGSERTTAVLQRDKWFDGRSSACRPPRCASCARRPFALCASRCRSVSTGLRSGVIPTSRRDLTGDPAGPLRPLRRVHAAAAP